MNRQTKDRNAKEGNAENRKAELRETENRQALAAAGDASLREAFLAEHQMHILRITGRITHSSMTYHDDEWAVAMLAVSEALDRYDGSKGDFWPFAEVLIKNRLTDHYRSGAGSRQEMSVRPEVFDGNVEDTDPDFALQMQVSRSMAVSRENSLRDEIEAVSQELAEYGISFFELADCSPRTGKTRKSCAETVAAMFLPPPLLEALRKAKALPIKEIMKRTKVTRKLLDRHRKYLIASALILDGDYPGISEYLAFIREEIPGSRNGNTRK